MYGLVGALVALPIAAVLRETVVYLNRHLVFEPWGAASPLLSGAERAPPAGAGARGRPEAPEEDEPTERVPAPR